MANPDEILCWSMSDLGSIMLNGLWHVCCSLTNPCMFMQEIVEILQQEAAMCKHILALEADEADLNDRASSSKWPTITLAQIQALIGGMLGSASPEMPLENASLYRQLQSIDRLRHGFYEDAAKGSAKILIQSTQ